MNEQQSSYRQIIKATSIFGGVQVFNIIIQIIRSKAIAILLGPAGMGIMGLLNSTLLLMGSLTSFGLKTSAVKHIAEANRNENTENVSIAVSVLRRLVWITGLLGMILTIMLAPWLSKLTFGNDNYTFPFIYISISLLFNQISSGQLVVLQGLRKIKYLANANLTGAVIGLASALPLYYLFGIDGIGPAIISVSLANMLRSWYFARKVKMVDVHVSLRTTFIEGKDMLIMGFMLSLSSLITTGTSYILRAYISNLSGIEQVGLYSAGFAIVNSYVGLIFSAMRTDYYPRLSEVACDNSGARKLMNQQGELTVLMLAPILMFFFVYINLIIIILYSNKFTPIDGMIKWAALGLYFKAASWSIGFIFLAKGASHIFLFSELSANAYILLFNIFGFKFFGLSGLGISFLISNILLLFQVFVIAKLKYEFKFYTGFYRIFLVQLTLGLTCFLIVNFLNAGFSYILGTLLIIVSLYFSYFEINKRIDIKALLLKYFKSKR